MALATAELRTTVLPPLTVSTDDLGLGGEGGGGSSSPSGSSSGGLSSVLLRVLRPSWTVSSPLGTSHGAPYGEPGDGWTLGLPVLLVALATVLGFAVYGVVALVRRKR